MVRVHFSECPFRTSQMLSYKIEEQESAILLGEKARE